MWHLTLESGWLSKRNNLFTIQLPEEAKSCIILQISCESPQTFNKHLTFTVVDKNGCGHNLPLIFNSDELDTYKELLIIADGCKAQKRFFQANCTMKGWPKELQRPIANFYSITTVEISKAEEPKIPFRCQYRIKGKDDWINGTLITFENIEEIYECQINSTLDDGIIVYSTITDVTCMWKNFDIENETSLDLEQMIVKKNFSIRLNPKSIYQTEYTATMRLIASEDDENDENDNNEETVVIQSEENIINDYPLIPGAQYEFKMTITKFNILYSKIIDVPVIPPIDDGLWTKLFGQVDHVNFTSKKFQRIQNWFDMVAEDGRGHDVNINWRYLKLYKEGFWQLKHNYQFQEGSVVEDKSQFQGTFVLSANDSLTAKISLATLYSSKSNKDLISKISRSRSNVQTQALALQIYDIIWHIAYFCDDYKEKLGLRLVCKNWFLAVPTTYHGTISAKSGRIFDFDFKYEVAEQRENKPMPK